VSAWCTALPLCVALALASPVSAQEEDEELAELLDVLSEETEVATRTRMNSDYVPGIVTVLDAERISQLGARTVWDAMSFVPGVEAWRDASGTPTISVRGIPFPFNSGSVQVLIDSVPIAAEAAGINGAALLMPIELVERIEFVRGPGSVIYGDYAFQGLLNIITRSEGSQADVAVGSRGRRSANVRVGSTTGDWKLTAQLAGFDADDASVPANRSAEEDRQFATLNLQRFGFGVRINAIRRDVDGLNAAMPVRFDERSHAIEARYDREWRDGLQTRFRVQKLANEIATGAITFDGGHTEGAAEVLWTGFAGQTWLAGFEYNDASIDSASQRPQPIPGRPPPPVTVIGHNERVARSVFVQGQFELLPTLQGTIGARYDDNESVGSRTTPRVSLVWRAAENHILKAQYAEGFRSPTFFELYTVPTQPALDFEVNRTSEINYVYQRADTTARVTLFRSRISDMVFRNFGFPGFGNVAMAQSDGVELEWIRQFNPNWRLDTALAWVDSQHNRNNTLAVTDIGAAADWFGNVGVLWSPDALTNVGLRWTHVGERAGAPAGESAYDRVDASYTRRDFFFDGLELQLSVQNVFDDRHVYLNPNPSGVDQPIVYEERVGWVRVGWEW
jgi:outer membrane receptor for ferrienterochelin and colicins